MTNDIVQPRDNKCMDPLFILINITDSQYWQFYRFMSCSINKTINLFITIKVTALLCLATWG